MNLLICTCIILPGGLYIICYHLVFVFWVSRATSPECRLLVESSAVSSPPVEANTYYHTLFYTIPYHTIPYHTYILYSMNTIYTFTIPSSIKYMYNCTCCLCCCRGTQAVAVTRASQPSQPASGISMLESKQT